MKSQPDAAKTASNERDVPMAKLPERRTAVKQPVDLLECLAATRGFASSAWKLLETLGTIEGYTPEPHHLSTFLDAVSQCRTAPERSTLIILGQGLFHFDPLEAFEIVEAHMLERMATAEGGR